MDDWQPRESLMLLKDDEDICYLTVDSFQPRIDPLKVFKPKPLKKLKVIHRPSVSLPIVSEEEEQHQELFIEFPFMKTPTAPINQQHIFSSSLNSAYQEAYQESNEKEGDEDTLEIQEKMLNLQIKQLKLLKSKRQQSAQISRNKMSHQIYDSLKNDSCDAGLIFKSEIDDANISASKPQTKPEEVKEPAYREADQPLST